MSLCACSPQLSRGSPIATAGKPLEPKRDALPAGSGPHGLQEVLRRIATELGQLARQLDEAGGCGLGAWETPLETPGPKAHFFSTPLTPVLEKSAASFGMTSRSEGPPLPAGDAAPLPAWAADHDRWFSLTVGRSTLLDGRREDKRVQKLRTVESIFDQTDVASMTERIARNFSTSKRNSASHNKRTSILNAVQAIKSEPKRSSPLTRLLRLDREVWTMLLDSVMGAVIVLNVIVMGINCDLERDWTGWIVIDGIFALLFLLECGLKIGFFGWRSYFMGKDARWNIFEFLLAVLAASECILAAFQKDGSGIDQSGNASLLRLCRLFRITRILRVCRLQMFGDLMIMINGTLGGLRTLGWSVILICMPLYLISMFFRETLREVTDQGNGAEAFSSLAMSFFTLFRCMVAGDCSEASGRPIFWHLSESYSWLYGAVYAVTYVFMTLGLFNVIVAIFVENVVVAARTNDELNRRRRLHDSHFFASKMQQLLRFILEVVEHKPRASTLSAQEAIQKAADIEITPDLFSQLMEIDGFVEVLHDLDVSDEEQFNLFQTLDVDGSGTVDVGELVEGISKLRGEARRGDVVALDFILQKMQAESRRYFETLLGLIRQQSRMMRSMNGLPISPRDRRTGSSY